MVRLAGTDALTSLLRLNWGRGHAALGGADTPGHLQIVDVAASVLFRRVVGLAREMRLRANPNIFPLNYDLTTLTVTNLVIIPKHFLTIDMIEKKKPLGPAARHKGWVGCKILIQTHTAFGRDRH